MNEQNQLAQIVNESGLEKTKAQVLLDNFSNYFQIASEWENKSKILLVTDESQITEMKMAREGRLFLKEKRIAVENTRKQLKEQSLREGQTIDAIAKILKNLIEPIEEYLEKQEKFKEIKEANEKAYRKEKRVKILTDLQFDFTYTDLLNMPEDQFCSLVLKLENERDARIEAEKKAERERVEREKAEAEERERIKIENERLKKEAEERERIAEIERKKNAEILEKQRKEAEEKARIEREKQAKIEAELKAKADAERKERERIEAELKAKKEAEEKAEKERIASERKAANAPEKEKLIAFSNAINNLHRPEFKTHEAIAIMQNIETLLTKTVNYIKENAEKL